MQQKLSKLKKIKIFNRYIILVNSLIFFFCSVLVNCMTNNFSFIIALLMLLYFEKFEDLLGMINSFLNKQHFIFYD